MTRPPSPNRACRRTCAKSARPSPCSPPPNLRRTVSWGWQRPSWPFWLACSFAGYVGWLDSPTSSLSVILNRLSPPFLSIIIPAHNEEKRLPGTLEQVFAFLGKQAYESEVLIVENGSSDRT